MKKKIVSICLVMALLAVGAVGMYAYFTDTSETAVNTFTQGDVQITLDEAKVDEYGEKVAGADRVTANEYLMIPGHTYTKDPTTYVEANSEECYVRMKVKVTGLSALKDTIPEDQCETYFSDGTKTGVLLLQEFVDGWNKDTWKADGTWAFDATTDTYEFRYKETVAKSATKTELPSLFTSFTLPTFLDNADIKYLKDNGLEIDVTAEAIQADGLDDADAAWAAFDAQ